MAVEITLPIDKKWTVYEVPANDPKLSYKGSPAWGLTYYKIKSIYIDKELAKDHKLEVIRHELTHAVIFETQLSEHKKYNEEDMCELVARYGKIIVELAEKVSNKLNKEK